MSLTFGSLFAGIGGFDLGLERAGMTCKWQVEINDYCRKVLTKHWPEVPKYEDVRYVGKHNLQSVDLICGGFPCQDVSLAGERKGLAGERSTLWSEFHRIICEIKPRWVLVENVPGLLSSDDGEFFGKILRDLAESGYDAEWQIVPAAAFGAIHLRKRVFILAYPNSFKFQGWQIAPKAGGSKARKKQFSRFLQSRFGATLSRPNNDRNSNGLSSRVDRFTGLGNAVVPQVAQYLGELIMEVNE